MKVDDDKAVIHVSQITAPKFKEWITKFWQKKLERSS
jgi:hypothetical protein